MYIYIYTHIHIHIQKNTHIYYIYTHIFIFIYRKIHIYILYMDIIYIHSQYYTLETLYTVHITWLLNQSSIVSQVGSSICIFTVGSSSSCETMSDLHGMIQIRD